jgi:hypothetical protein
MGLFRQLSKADVFALRRQLAGVEVDDPAAGIAVRITPIRILSPSSDSSL